MRRLLTVLVLASAAVLGTATPASAHTVGGTGATNFKTVLLGLQPATTGLRVRVIDHGARLELSDNGPEVTVLGYAGEPYLRVGPSGVFENTHSPAVYQNSGTTGIPVPPQANATAVPAWRQISTGHTARWHNHRIHWNGGQLPDSIRHSAGTAQLVRTWKVPLVEGQQPVLIFGTLSWVPGPAWWPWAGLALLLLAGTVLIAKTTSWAYGLAAALGLLIVTDAIHALGVGYAYAGTTAHRLVLVLAGSYYSIIAWVVGLLAIRLLLRRNIDGIFPATFTGLLLGVFSGMADITVLYRSQAPFAWSADLERLSVAVALGAGIGTVIGAVLAFRAEQPQAVEEAV